MGAPGGGKGTISKKLVKDYGFGHISTGDVLRANVAAGTPLGQEAQGFMDSGGLVPDTLMVSLVKDALQQSQCEHVLLDGFPRTVGQAAALDAELKIDLALNLEVPTEEIVERISNRWVHLASGRVYAYDFNPPKAEGKDDETGEPLVQRDDDKPEAVRRRLEAYRASTVPLVDHYRAQGVLSGFDGSGSPELVADNRRSDAIYAALKPVVGECIGGRAE
jgi:adenylate kinase